MKVIAIERVKMSVAENIQRARKRKGLTQEKAAEKTGIPIVSYRNYEQGRQSPSAERLKQIASGLGVSADALLFGEENKDLGEDMKVVFRLFDNLPKEIKKHAWIALRGVVMTYEAEMLEMIKDKENQKVT